MKGGSKGKSFNDRELAGQVRNLALGHLKKILSENYEDKEYQKQMLLKLANTLLPRLNELSGENGGPIELKTITGMTISKDDADTIQNEEPEATTSK